VFIPLGIAGVVLLFIVFMMMSRTDSEDANSVNVSVAAKRAANDNRAAHTENIQTTSVPPATDGRTINVPPPQTTTQTTTVQGATAPIPPDRGVVMIDAKMTAGNGSPEAVKNEKFYLLDEDVESILSEAGLTELEGQSLTNSLGLSMIYPDRYADFHRAALNAINRHIKYSVQTDSSGRAQIRDVKPENYYLFGITRTGRSFAVWNSPVVVTTGQNALNLTPQPLTEVGD
jgi:hypothetical protein